MKFSSLAALKVVKMTTSSAASDENFVKMTTFPFQCSDAVYPVEYAYSFVVLAVVAIIQSLPFGLTQFIYPHSSGLPHRHTIVSLLQFQWSDQQDRL